MAGLQWAPWRMEATEADDRARMRFLPAAHNYVKAKALGWDAKTSGGQLLAAALRLPATPKTETVINRRRPEAELAEVCGDPFECG